VKKEESGSKEMALSMCDAPRHFTWRSEVGKLHGILFSPFPSSDHQATTTKKRIQTKFKSMLGSTLLVSESLRLSR
jgi:hypothetical protein